MALLGLFSKREKHKSPGSSSASTANKSSNGSVADSSEDYVLPDPIHASALPNNVYSNPEASSSKFHLGFHRKKSNIASELTESTLLRPPSQPHLSSTRSEADMDEIRPPPSKASLFSAYGDPLNALSTRSLPTERTDAARPSAPQRGSIDVPPRRSTDGGLRNGNGSADPPAPPKKPSGLFSWAHRERKKKSSDTPPSAEPPRRDTSGDSFNLKSFRHIGGDDSSAILVPPARPRPRGDSTTSDTAQRISVAAFREMAARRSAAGSPTHSHTSSPVLLRPPSRSDSLEHSPFRSPASSFQRSPVAAIRQSSLAISSGSTSSESEDTGESESDDSTSHPRRQRTLTQKTATKASSDAGHTIRASDSTPTPARSMLQVSPSSSSSGASGVRADSRQVSESPKVGSSDSTIRARASVSTSALQPNAAAKRASLLAAQEAQKPLPPLSARAREKARAQDSDSDSDSDSSQDSDDAPLATFMRPSRPGSSASNNTNPSSRSRIPTKPLIDITKLTTPPLPPLPAPGDRPTSPKPKKEQEKIPTPPEKDRHSRNLERFEKDMSSKSSHSHSAKPSVTDRLARVAQTAAASKSVEKLADAQPLERRSVDSKITLHTSEDTAVPRGRLPVPTRSQTAPLGLFEGLGTSISTSTDASASSSASASGGGSRSSPPLLRTHPKPRSYSSSSPNPAAAYDLTDPTPIVPTPIRQRSPPPAFSVTSRPASQLSLNASPGANPRLSSASGSSQPTIRMVEYSTTSSTSASSSPTTPNTPWTTSPETGEIEPVTTARLQKQAHQQQQQRPPLGHFSSSTPQRSAPTSAASSPAPPASAAPRSETSTVHARSMSPPDKLVSRIPSPPQSQAQAPPMHARQRSSTLVPNGGLPLTDGFTGGGLLASRAAVPQNTKGSSTSGQATARQRSSTVLPELTTSSSPSSGMPPRRLVDLGTQPPKSGSNAGGNGPTSTSGASQPHRLPARQRIPFDGSSNTPAPTARPPSSLVGMGGNMHAPPQKPFARPERGNSPASSTGDSSSGRTPLTPADGSDYGYTEPATKSVVSAMAGARKGHRRGASVTFEDDEKPAKDSMSVTSRAPAKGPRSAQDADEERRKERRRSEAKAAIELGNVVNGRITLDAEEEDELAPLNPALGPRMSMVNPMMGFGPSAQMMPMNMNMQMNMQMGGWQSQGGPAGMMGMVPPGAGAADPRFFAAHQHAMAVAKQAYQMAVAQQALAAANEEWERGSSVSAMSSMGAGMGMPAMGMPMMGGMGGMMPGGYGMQWTNPGAMMFPSSASMYTGSVLGSELGVPTGHAGWGTQSEYGGPSAARGSRTSAMFAPRPGGMPNMNSARSEYGGPTSSSAKPNGVRPRTKTSPSDAPLPPQHAHANTRHHASRAPPPSSWKPGAR